MNLKSKKFIVPDRNKSARGSDKYHVPNIERCLTVIELLAQRREGLTLSEIVSILSLPKNSVFRITATLLAHGYLYRDDGSKKFTLNGKLLKLGYSAVSEYSIVAESYDIMQQLRDVVKETVLIGALVHNEFIAMEQAVGVYPFKFMLDIGSRIPLHTAAPAKAILAFLPERQLADVLETMDFERFNERTATTAADYRAMLEEVRQTGFAVDYAEQLAGVHCVGAPVFDRYGYPVASIWTTGPSERLASGCFDVLGQQVKEHADRISQRLT